jgi:hypothetical protein
LNCILSRFNVRITSYRNTQTYFCAERSSLVITGPV